MGNHKQNVFSFRKLVGIAAFLAVIVLTGLYQNCSPTQDASNLSSLGSNPYQGVSALRKVQAPILPVPAPSPGDWTKDGETVIATEAGQGIISASPDGAHLVLVSSPYGTIESDLRTNISVFAIDAKTGIVGSRLFFDSYSANQGTEPFGGAEDTFFSADGKFAVVAGHDTMALFSRDNDEKSSNFGKLILKKVLRTSKALGHLPCHNASICSHVPEIGSFTKIGFSKSGHDLFVLEGRLNPVAGTSQFYGGHMAVVRYSLDSGDFKSNGQYDFSDNSLVFGFDVDGLGNIYALTDKGVSQIDENFHVVVSAQIPNLYFGTGEGSMFNSVQVLNNNQVLASYIPPAVTPPLPPWIQPGDIDAWHDFYKKVKVFSGLWQASAPGLSSPEATTFAVDIGSNQFEQIFAINDDGSLMVGRIGSRIYSIKRDSKGSVVDAKAEIVGAVSSATSWVAKTKKLYAAFIRPAQDSSGKMVQSVGVYEPIPKE